MNRNMKVSAGLLLAMLVLSGCSKPADHPPVSKPGDVAAQQRGDRADNGNDQEEERSADDRDPCQLLSASEAQTILGTLAVPPYTVKDGDTLSSIADSFGIADSARTTWTASVLQLNNKDSADTLAVGESLKIPVISASNQATTGASSTLMALFRVSAASGASTIEAGSVMPSIRQRVPSIGRTR